MKRKLCLVICCLMMTLVMSCFYQESSTEKEGKIVEAQLSQYSKGQPVPAFDWSFERDLVIQLYALRNAKVATHTVWRSDYGMIEGDSPSLGFGIPYDTSLTNPLQLTAKRIKTYGGHRTLEGTVEQQEPNGIFASKNTTATWVMSVDADTSQILPIYVESKVTVYPYPVTVDYENSRVHKAGKASTSLTK